MSTKLIYAAKVARINKIIMNLLLARAKGVKTYPPVVLLGYAEEAALALNKL